MNLNLSECQDLWGDRPPKDQLADKSKTAKEIPPKRGSLAEEFPEEQLSREKKHKRITRYKSGTSVLKPKSQEQLDMPGINIKYRNEQPSWQKRTIRGVDGEANKDRERISATAGRLHPSGAEGDHKKRGPGLSIRSTKVPETTQKDASVTYKQSANGTEQPARKHQKRQFVCPKWKFVCQKLTIVDQKLPTFDHKLPKLALLDPFLFNFDPLSGLNSVIVK